MPPLLEVNHLKKYFPIKKGFWQRVVGHVKAVDDVSFTINKGETFGLVGESGSGKSTTARLILRGYGVTSGELLFHKADGTQVDITTLNKIELKRLRRDIQMIFQDPFSSLNPRMTVLQIVGEPLEVHNIASGNDITERVAALLTDVGLRPEIMNRYPHAFSGGQRQRISIARALALNPSFIAADEAVSALDVSVAAQNLNLLKDLQDEHDLTYLFITHDLSTVQHISDRLAVMYVGQLVEIAETETLFNNPLHPYTEALLSAVPRPDPDFASQKKRIVLRGDVADPSNPPSGCYFHPRCNYATDECKTQAPEFREVQAGHWVRCHHADTLDLAGVA
ncbi:MAG: ABC transporter ATP-binding protein [Deinococcota bacterium]